MNVNDNIDGAPANNHQQQQYKIDPAMKIGHVSLNVSNLSRSLDFYESVLGFKRIGRPSSGGKALLSVGDNNSSYLVELLQVNTTTDANNGNLSRRNSSIRRAGLYHFAIL